MMFIIKILGSKPLQRCGRSYAWHQSIHNECHGAFLYEILGQLISFCKGYMNCCFTTSHTICHNSPTSEMVEQPARNLNYGS